MDGSVWHEDPSIIYTGIITKREKYRGRNRELVDGYEVRWCDGNRENWPYESLLPCLVPVMSSFENDDVITVVGERLKSSENDKINDDNSSSSVKKVNSDSESDCDDPEKIDFEGEYISDSDDDDGEVKPED